jgi:tRNA(adenine34) deaminase
MPTPSETDHRFMAEALEDAREAAERGEVPIGAVLVIDNETIARAGNRTITHCDPTAHAEILALRDAALKTGNYRLLGATLYVTIEPCAMCAGAMIQARIARLVYGADEAKGGAVRSCFEVLSHDRTNHRVDITAGVLAEESVALLQGFFSTRRGRATENNL